MSVESTLQSDSKLARERAFWLIAALYGLSGLTSLSYEVLWARMLSLQFGVSVFAVVLTVAAFIMLALGPRLSSTNTQKKQPR